MNPLENDGFQKAVLSAEQAPSHRHHSYKPAFDVLRLLCMACIIIIEFGIPLPYYAYVEPFLYFAPCFLFASYGFLVLRDGKDLKKNVRHALKVFLILFGVYGGLTAAYCWFLYGNPLVNLSLRSIFNFVVLNYWGMPFCASIWYVQSTLYALIVFRLVQKHLRKLIRFDWLACILLFAVSVLLGELADLIDFSLLGYTFIPGNFFTRTMPYMLLGRILRQYSGKIQKWLPFHPLYVALAGLGLAAVEFFMLGATENLFYTNHFIGFIVVASALCIYADNYRIGGPLPVHAATIYKGMYYLYNPLGYLALLSFLLFLPSEKLFSVCCDLLGIGVVLFTFCVFLLISVIRQKRHPKEAEKYETTLQF